MKKFYNFKTLVALSLVIIIGLGISLVISKTKFENSLKVADAAPYVPATGAGHNVSGFAWSSNVGWISFNSVDCDNNGIQYDGTPAGCPVAGTDFFDYGVHINPSTGTTSGYAWSDNVGWISFQEDGTTSGIVNFYGFSTDACAGATCCSEVCDASNNCTACYNSTDNRWYGWAKILSLGDDGWIKLDNSGGGAGAYDLNIPDLATGYLEGWAYNEGSGGAGIGWISFNSANPGAGAGADYKVTAEVNQMPEITDMNADAYAPAYYCLDTGSVKDRRLQWTYNDPDGDSQLKYRLILDDDNNADFETEHVFDTGECQVAGGDCVIDPNGTGLFQFLIHNAPLIQALPGGGLSFNQPYYWWLKVWDDKGGESDWYFSGVGPVAGCVAMVDANFTIPTNEYPDPDDFSWFPKSPSVDEDVRFVSVDKAKYYDSAGAEHGCTEATCVWTWATNYMGDDSILPNASDLASTTIMKFGSEQTDRQVTLTVEQKSTNYSCSSTTSAFETGKRLPSWIESR